MGVCGSSQEMDIETTAQSHTKAPPPPPPQSVGDLFVTAKDGKLWLGPAQFRFASLCAPELLDGDANQRFEVEDTFATLGAGNGFARAVTRTYTLRIKSKNIGRGHINGWNSGWGDWEWDSGRLEEFDFVLNCARRHGVRLIVPIINQDYGDESTNWVGNQTDLMRMRKGTAGYDEAKHAVDWWTDEEMINSFKLIIDKLLNRKNSINGIRYGDDPTILAWETGNEMNHQGMRPAPGSWTCIIAKHLKHLAPNTLVMDGSFARTEHVEACYAPEVLSCPDVDILSYHYYGSGDIDRIKKDCWFASTHRKVFVAGEYGFFEKKDDYARFLKLLDETGGAGSLAWSLRPHSRKGGFNTHGEGNGIWSYHIPGHPNPQHPEFDPREQAIIAAIRQASFKINKERVPSAYPVPSPPRKPFAVGQGAVAFTGAAWAAKYEIGVRQTSGGETVVRVECDDSTKEGQLAVQVGGDAQFVVVRGVSVDGKRGEWSEEAQL